METKTQIEKSVVVKVELEIEEMERLVAPVGIIDKLAVNHNETFLLDQ